MICSRPHSGLLSCGGHPLTAGHAGVCLSSALLRTLFDTRSFISLPSGSLVVPGIECPQGQSITNEEHESMGKKPSTRSSVGRFSGALYLIPQSVLTGINTFFVLFFFPLSYFSYSLTCASWDRFPNQPSEPNFFSQS